ncbi:putative permease [Frankia canadensis]|uniref:Putative permease n=1 Tax=Frankia canadensis TaxID=1836972 RepID=A0A2I2KMK1_9ACTN|nr:AEC family transporter [Frankia canadensis]SNQ46879.1 putative permease [Frankia canadensis]SOU54169.1 putative permease [Frankia canadensis]
MSALVVLVVGLLAGIVVRRRRHLPPGAAAAVNSWLLDIALPALVLHELHDVRFPANLALVVAAPYLLFAVTIGLYLLAARTMRLPRTTVTALIAATAVANTSFVGFPMVTVFYGADSVPIAVLVDQLGSFLLLNTVVLGTVTIVAGASLPRAELARRVLTAPALLALLAALVLRPVSFPGWLDTALASLGATLTPLALFSIGLQLEVRAVRRWWWELALGLGVKLVAAPAIVVGLYALTGRLGDHAVTIALFETAMPPMVAGALIAARYDLAPPLPSLLVGVGVPLSFATLPLWSLVLGS